MHTHERSREHTQPLGAHTSTALAAGPGGGGVEGRSGSPGLAVPPAAPLQRLAQQAAAPARPAQPRQGAAARGTGERGVSPAALGAEGRGGARPWGRGPGAYKIALRPDINKPCQATLSCG